MAARLTSRIAARSLAALGSSPNCPCTRGRWPTSLHRSYTPLPSLPSHLRVHRLGGVQNLNDQRARGVAPAARQRTPRLRAEKRRVGRGRAEEEQLLELAEKLQLQVRGGETRAVEFCWGTSSGAGACVGRRGRASAPAAGRLRWPWRVSHAPARSGANVWKAASLSAQRVKARLDESG
ncbi:hypothetical protein AB1Y20_006447 [Prymnesium parvum]|uniref:Uncharacterized protein n=1 Tax=Prymnesium parvum TaxID=97485 RepID=A0AB34J0N0_PRYPA